MSEDEGSGAWQRALPRWQARQDRYGPEGTTDSPQYDALGRPTGREAGAAARSAERKALEEERNHRRKK